ncbi:MAG: hypothetical protein U0T82_16000 [Bacteroidales bacterium]
MSRHLTIRPMLMCLVFIITTFPCLQAQEKGSNYYGKDKEQQEQERSGQFAETIALVSSRQFVFQAEFNQNSDQVFVLVDTTYGEVQNGIRSNLDGSITKWVVKINEKKRTLSVTFKIKSALSTADVFLLVGEGGHGQATIRRDTWGAGSTHSAALNAEYSKGFSFNGNLVDFENCDIYEGKSHLVH